MTFLIFEIRGEPRPKGRPQFARRGKFVTSYTPAATRDAEADVRSQIIAQLKPGFVPLQGALNISAVFRRLKPKSASKKVKYPTTRPDLDNYMKLLLDAMNQVVFVDDGQIVVLLVSKVFDETPGITVTVMNMEG